MKNFSNRTWRIRALILAGALSFAMLFSGCQQQIPEPSEESTTKVSTSEATTAEKTTEGTTVAKTTEEKTTEEKTTEEATIKPASLHIDVADYPVMDGSTANLPMMAEIMSRVCGISLEEAQEKVGCSTTAYAWTALANGDADILLVYEAPEATKTELQNIGTVLETSPIGRDGLVFIKNEANPVKNISTEDLLGIYTGQITNWKELGGKDEEIVPFQRVEDSGSQSLFRKLLMKDQEPTDAPSTLRPSSMGDLIDGLADYNGEGSAIGYSVYYYASYMYSKPGLEFFSVDGITPNEETIGDGTYPFVNEFYLVIRADAPENSPARQLRDWILSDEGRQAIIDAGYIPMPKMQDK